MFSFTGSGGWLWVFRRRGSWWLCFRRPTIAERFDNAGGMMSVDETLMCSFQVRKMFLRSPKVLLVLLSAVLQCAVHFACSGTCSSHQKNAAIGKQCNIYCKTHQVTLWKGAAIAGIDCTSFTRRKVRSSVLLAIARKTTWTSSQFFAKTGRFYQQELCMFSDFEAVREEGEVSVRGAEQRPTGGHAPSRAGAGKPKK